MIEANRYGWTSARILASFAIAAVLLVAFVWIEIHGRTPMLDVSLFRNTTYVGANLVMLLVALAMFGVFFFVSLYMQNVLGYSAVQAGAAFLPMTMLIVLIAPVTGKLSDRFGSRWFLTGGLSLLGVQLLYFSRLGATATYWELLPAFIIGGIGMAMTMTPASAAAMRAVPVDRAGVGSAVLNSARQVGGSLGIAIMGAIVAASVSVTLQTAYQSGNPALIQKSIHQFVNGFSNALVVAAIIAFAGALVAAVLVRHEVHEEQPQVPETVERVEELVG